MNIRQLDTGSSTEHAQISPSALSDIILCPGRVRMQEGVKDITSYAAAEGSAAHYVAEQKLLCKTGIKKGDEIKVDGHTIPVDQEMFDAVQVYVDHIEKLRGLSLYKEENIEKKVSLKHIGLPEIYGTVDFSMGVLFSTLYIRDYKYGQGIVVNPEYNPQLMTYAIGAGNDLLDGFETINIGIVQPRGKDKNPVKVWKTTPDVLVKWAEDILKPTVKLAQQDNAPLNPGEQQCRWCRAADICPALAQKALTVAQADFKDFTDIQPDKLAETLSIEEVTKVYDKLPLLKKFIKTVEGRVFSELESGGGVPGYKLVHGRKSRSWHDEQEAADALKIRGVDPYQHKLVSPAQAEKLLNKTAKKEVQQFIKVSPGNPVIAPEDDKREAINTAKNDFKIENRRIKR